MTQRPVPTTDDPLLEPGDLTHLWSFLLGPEPLRARSLWLLFIDPERRPTGPVITLDDLPDGPYDVPRADLVGWCRDILDGPGGLGGPDGADSVAFLLARPGSAPWTVSDRAWGRFLVAAREEVGRRPWPVHWAHRGGVEELRLP